MHPLPAPLQAKEFNETVQLSGIILTKLDGTARGGAVVRQSRAPGWLAGSLPVAWGCQESVSCPGQCVMYSSCAFCLRTNPTSS